PNLFYAATDVAAGQVPEVAAAGYPGSAAGTVFYGVDSARDTLVTAGSRTGQLRTVGKLGLDVKESHGFDIKGTASAIAAVQPQGSGAALLVEIDLATGTGRPLVPLAGRPVGLTYLP
ncbi:MAG TPA: DUF4394 domain-containing protein, partial [Micromonosporaceae bacterium]|nr:DUF4394 domain-containing protein [Micromonosporaceae bacterium]